MKNRIKENHKKFYDYNEKDLIGVGGFAKVYKAISKETSENVAIKVISLYEIGITIEDDDDETIDSYIEGFRKEIEYMQIIEGEKKENKNTVKFLEYFENEDEFVMVMELCNTNLEKVLKKKQKKDEKFSTDEIYNILSQLNNSLKIMVKKK